MLTGLLQFLEHYTYPSLTIGVSVSCLMYLLHASINRYIMYASIAHVKYDNATCRLWGLPSVAFLTAHRGISHIQRKGGYPLCSPNLLFSVPMDD